MQIMLLHVKHCAKYREQDVEEVTMNRSIVTGYTNLVTGGFVIPQFFYSLLSHFLHLLSIHGFMWTITSFVSFIVPYIIRSTSSAIS